MNNNLKISEAIKELVTYSKLYGDVTIGEIEEIKLKLEMTKRGLPHKCAKCHGKGTVEETYDAYPKGLPDSGYANDWKTRDIKCDLCNGVGWTAKLYKPKMIQEGWD